MNLVRMLMIEAAAKRGEEPTRLSFTAALRHVVSTSIRMSTAPAWELPALCEIMRMFVRTFSDAIDGGLEDIGAETVSERPCRNEPRMKRRETKHYEALRTTRAERRQVHAAA